MQSKKSPFEKIPEEGQVDDVLARPSVENATGT